MAFKEGANTRSLGFESKQHTDQPKGILLLLAQLAERMCEAMVTQEVDKGRKFLLSPDLQTPGSTESQSDMTEEI